MSVEQRFHCSQQMQCLLCSSQAWALYKCTNFSFASLHFLHNTGCNCLYDQLHEELENASSILRVILDFLKSSAAFPSE